MVLLWAEISFSWQLSVLYKGIKDCVTIRPVDLARIKIDASLIEWLPQCLTNLCYEKTTKQSRFHDSLLRFQFKHVTFRTFSLQLDPRSALKTVSNKWRKTVSEGQKPQKDADQTVNSHGVTWNRLTFYVFSPSKSLLAITAYVIAWIDATSANV